MELKKCSRCDIDKPISEFSLKVSVKKGLVLRAWCTQCETIAKPKAIVNPALVKEKNTLARYGITVTDVISMGKSQGWICALCSRDISVKHYIDHSHKTGKVRSLLCFHCNVGLGQFFDSIELLQKAIEYLEKHNV